MKYQGPPTGKFIRYYIKTGYDLFECYKIIYLVLVKDKANARQTEGRDSNREGIRGQAR